MKYWIIIVMSLSACLAEAQQLDTLFSSKLLDEEVSFFSIKIDSEKISALENKADLYEYKREYEKALYELERAEKIPSDEKIKITLKYKKMLNYFLLNQFSQCISLSFTSSEASQINKQKEYFSMRFFSLNETGQWIKCREEMLSYCSLCDSDEVNKIKTLPLLYTYINPERCKRLSSFVPGLGMVETGNVFKGTTSLILQAGLTAFAGYNFYAGYYITGVVSGIFPLLKFHKGGNRLSTILADDRNEKEKRKLQTLYTDEIKRIVHL